MFQRRSLEEAVAAVGDLLADRNQSIEVVAIGGGALLLLGLIERSTRDLDLVGIKVDDAIIASTPLPAALKDAVDDVARVMDLAPGWLNGGPDSLLKLGLPDGFVRRAHRREYGGLTVHLASRFDQICFKLYASADDSPHHA